MFTQQHYKAIAEILRANQDVFAEFALPEADMTASRYHHQRIVRILAEMFARDNPRFDGDKFFTAATRPE